jgi:sporulation protein YlmC with PRC-barrel domain
VDGTTKFLSFITNEHLRLNYMQREKPLTRDALIGMQVIDSNARLVGKVKDLAFSVGKSNITLAVEKEDGSVQNVSWEEVQAASDFIILKPTQATYQVMPQQQPVSEQKTQQLCPTCGKPLTWIPQYERWYCYNDKKYV